MDSVQAFGALGEGSTPSGGIKVIKLTVCSFFYYNKLMKKIFFTLIFPGILSLIFIFSTINTLAAETLPPPEKISPYHGQTDLPARVTLSWNTVIGANKGYHYLVWSAADNSLVTDGTIDGTTAIINLSKGTNYLWSVESCWASGLWDLGRTCGGYTDSWAFTTGQEKHESYTHGHRKDTIW